MTGTTVCNVHGGKAPQVQAAVARRELVSKVEGDAKAELAHQGVHGGDFDPLETLSRTAAEIEAMKDALARRVNALEGLTSNDQLAVEISLYERFLDRLVRASEILSRLDLEGRKQAARERYAAEIVGLIQNVLEDLALSQAQWALIPQIMARRLSSGLEPGPARLEARRVDDDGDDGRGD